MKGLMNIDRLADVEKPLKWGQVKEIDLIRAMQKILERKRFSQKVEKTIAPDDTATEGRVIFIGEYIRKNTHDCIFNSFFESPSKSEVVTTFMVLLESMRKGQIIAQQKRNYESIMLYPAVGDTEYDGTK